MSHKPMSDSGKGSFRRNEDTQKVHDNWDLIFKKIKEKDEKLMQVDPNTEEDEWTCECCGGPMYRQAHWSYGRCDDCGARQDLIDDDYT